MICCLGGSEGHRQAESQEGFVRNQEPATRGQHPADDPPPQHCTAAGYPGDREQLLPSDGTVPRRKPHELHLRQETSGREGDPEVHPAAGAGCGAPAQGRCGSQVKKKTKQNKKRSTFIINADFLFFKIQTPVLEQYSDDPLLYTSPSIIKEKLKL